MSEEKRLPVCLSQAKIEKTVNNSHTTTQKRTNNGFREPKPGRIHRSTSTATSVLSTFRITLRRRGWGGGGGGGVGGWLGADYMNRAGLFWKYTKYQQVHGNKPMGDAGSPSCKLGSVQLNLKISVKRQTDPYGKAMKK